MSENTPDPKIHLAFRFHTNYYHSYRGDTPDELGFGKDIRIIRRIIEIFDEFNAKGVPACGTWDIENYFSLEKIMPEHCPDIIESLKRRVAEGKDEVEVMSYNNGLISAQTAVEFDDVIRRAITNSAGSGLKDIFGGFAPMVRPQEMMYTPMHLKMYPRHGVKYISLYYSSIPFNGFSNFMRVLPFEHRYNPLTLTYPGIEETMTLMPAYNHGDIADNISLRWWLKRLRRKQLSMPEPKNLLLLLDADADDEFWYGMDWPVISTFFAAGKGLQGLLQSVCDLDFLVFTTPGKYVDTHPPLGTITIGQDTADGSFDGFSSWAEKWSNHQLWTGIERSRILELQTRRLMDIQDVGEKREEIEELLAQSQEKRLRALSTTHFGLASPVMNINRLKSGKDIVADSVAKASRALELAADKVCEKKETGENTVDFALIDYVRGISTGTVKYTAKPSKALVRLNLAVSGAGEGKIGLQTSDGQARASCIRPLGDSNAAGGVELMFVESMNDAEQKDFQIDVSGGSATAAPVRNPVAANENALQNESITLRFDKTMQPISLFCSGDEIADGPFMQSTINYKGSILEVSRWTVLETGVLGNGLMGFVRVRGEIPFEPGGKTRAVVEREFMLVSDLPYLYVDTHVVYPETRSNNYNKGMARGLGREFDCDWREVMPCEMRPSMFGKHGRPLRVWKHNYLDHTSCYDLNYGEFSKNEEVDSFNNHVTHGWVAVTDREKGLLVGQTADVNSSSAFCPMRMRTSARGTQVFLNPFGSYYGNQLNYVTAFSGFGRFIAIKTGDSLYPHAPSYNGRTETFRLMLAPYSGDEPPEEIKCDAEAFAYPYAVLSRSDAIRPPEHTQWNTEIPGT